MTVTLDGLNAASREDFIEALGDLFEHSPWVAASAFEARPFQSRAALENALETALFKASPEAQLALIRAHPELGQRQRDTLTAASRREQQGAGLDGESERLKTLIALNDDYRTRHGFPFVIAVKGLDLDSVIAALERRLPRSQAVEIEESLRQINRIARLRLAERLESA